MCRGKTQANITKKQQQELFYLFFVFSSFLHLGQTFLFLCWNECDTCVIATNVFERKLLNLARVFRYEYNMPEKMLRWLVLCDKKTKLIPRCLLRTLFKTLVHSDVCPVVSNYSCYCGRLKISSTQTKPTQHTPVAFTKKIKIKKKCKQFFWSFERT